MGVSADNAYGVAVHSTVLGRLGVEDAEIDKMRSASPPSDARSAAVYDLAREIVLARGKVDDATITQATDAGLSTPEILEVVAECTLEPLAPLLERMARRGVDEVIATTPQEELRGVIQHPVKTA